MDIDTIFSNCTIATCSAAVTTKFGILPTNHIIALSNGTIAYIGPRAQLSEAHISKEVVCHDLQGKMITPGLIDCHTHVVYGGNRCGEWELKLQGATYEEVAQAGGGIVNTVQGTRSASVADLVNLAKPRIEAMLREGTTCIEIKSGYGLDLETERRMLQAGKQIGEL